MSGATLWDAVLTLGVLSFVVGGLGVAFGWIAQPLISTLAVLGLILIGAGASRKRRARSSG